MLNQQRLWTVAQVAEYLQVSDKTVRRLIAAGRLHSMRVLTQLRIENTELERFIASQRAAAAAERATGLP